MAITRTQALISAANTGAVSISVSFTNAPTNNGFVVMGSTVANQTNTLAPTDNFADSGGGAWTATLTDVSNGVVTWGYTILYTDGVSQKFQKTYTTDTLDDATVQATAVNEVTRLVAVEQSVGRLTLKVGSPIDLGGVGQ